MHLAAQNGHILVVEVLIRFRANINAVDKVCNLMNAYFVVGNIASPSLIEWINSFTFGCKK